MHFFDLPLHAKEYDCMLVRHTLLKLTLKIFGVPHMKCSLECNFICLVDTT